MRNTQRTTPAGAKTRAGISRSRGAVCSSIQVATGRRPRHGKGRKGMYCPPHGFPPSSLPERLIRGYEICVGAASRTASGARRAQQPLIWNVSVRTLHQMSAQGGVLPTTQGHARGFQSPRVLPFRRRPGQDCRRVGGQPAASGEPGQAAVCAQTSKEVCAYIDGD